MNKSIQSPSLKRRDFLKVCGGALGAALVQSARQPAQAAAQTVRMVDALGRDPQTEFAGRLYRGTVDGCILVSDDGGGNWTQQSVLHQGCAITRLQSNGRALLARLEFAGHTFDLISTDGIVWRNG